MFFIEGLGTSVHVLYIKAVTKSKFVIFVVSQVSDKYITSYSVATEDRYIKLNFECKLCMFLIKKGYTVNVA